MIETSSPQTWVLSFGFKHCNVLESNSEVVYLFDVPYLIYRTNVESHQCFINLSPCHWHGTNRCKFNCLISIWNCDRTPHEKKHNIDNRTQTLTIFAKTTWTHLQNQIYSVLFNIPESNRNNLSKMTNHRRPKYPLCLPSPMLGQNFVDSGDLAQNDLGTALPRTCEPCSWWWLNVTPFNHSRWFNLEKFGFTQLRLGIQSE